MGVEGGQRGRPVRKHLRSRHFLPVPCASCVCPCVHSSRTGRDPVKMPPLLTLNSHWVRLQPGDQPPCCEWSGCAVTASVCSGGSGDRGSGQRSPWGPRMKAAERGKARWHLAGERRAQQGCRVGWRPAPSWALWPSQEPSSADTHRQLLCLSCMQGLRGRSAPHWKCTLR